MLEVNSATVAVGIEPIGFGVDPGSGIHYPSKIVEITRGEFEQLTQGRLKLPNGWTIGEEYGK